MSWKRNIYFWICDKRLKMELYISDTVLKWIYAISGGILLGLAAAVVLVVIVILCCIAKQKIGKCKQDLYNFKIFMVYSRER